MISKEKLALDDFHPKPQLVRRETLVERPRFPVIDAHNHLGPNFGGGWDTRPVAELIDFFRRSVLFRQLGGCA